MKYRYKFKEYDIKLVILIIALTVIGIFAIGSAKQSVQMKQIIGAILGLFLMILISFFNYSSLLKLYWPMYIGNLILLILVMLIGDSSNNAQRWVEIAGIRFQPSETAKILLILFYAQFIMKREDKLNTLSNLTKCIVLLIPPWVLIYKQPDLSTSIVVFCVFAICLYIGGLNWKIIVGVLAVTIPIVVISLFIILQPGQDVIESYQQDRILAWLYPDKYALSTAYQQRNSITAIGSGQLWGKGLNNNEVGSVKNGNYISEPQTDFIFAIIGEEMGFVGSASVIILLCCISAECFKIGRFAKDLAGRIICSGMGGLVLVQGFINIAVTTGVLPNTGLPLPFVSYGLTSLVSLYIGMGFVLNVALQRVYPKGF